jgi:hypothetical protein
MLAESRVVPSPADGESGASYSPLGLHPLTTAIYFYLNENTLVQFTQRNIPPVSKIYETAV